MSADSSRYEVYRDAAGEHRWRLRARNGEIVAVSGDGLDGPAHAVDAARTAARVTAEAAGYSESAVAIGARVPVIVLEGEG